MVRRTEGLDRDERKSHNPVATTSRRPDHIQGGQAREAILGVLLAAPPKCQGSQEFTPRGQVLQAGSPPSPLLRQRL